jgi:hypothetical protein
MLARMKDRQMALLDEAINTSRDHLGKLEALIKYEIDRIFTVPEDRNGKPVKLNELPNVPIALVELFKVYSIVQRDMVRFSGAEQPLKQLLLVGKMPTAKSHVVDAVSSIQIILCDSEYGEFGKDRVKIRRLNSAGAEDPLF